MTPATTLPRHLLRLALAACVPLAAHAGDDVRSPCSLSPAGDGVASDSADARGLVLDAHKGLAVANWDVRWHERQRLWVTLTATNRGDVPATIRAEFATDLGADGARTGGVAAPARTIAPHASATQRLAFYVPAQARTAAVLLHAETPGAAVAATLALECSDRRFDPGEMTRPAAALLEEALRQYSADVAEPIANPRQALEILRVQASGAQDATDIAWALRGLMLALHDDRSAVVLPGDDAPPAPPAPAPARPPSVELDADGIATVRLSSSDAASEPARLDEATRLHGLVAAMAARRPLGWIVDLREAGGTDMWAALAALGPLLDGPAVGAFVRHDGRQAWIVDRGAARTAGERGGQVFVDLQLSPEPPFSGPVAVLVGPRTCGAGERLAVAFEGRPRTRFFGAPSAGRDDAGLLRRTLSDGTVLAIAATLPADRNDVVYRDGVEPDQPVADDAAAAPQASAWLLSVH